MKEKFVLVVDDEKNIRLTLSQTLESLGLETDTAVNGEEALDKLKMKEFGLILLDLKMPGMDGMEVLRQLRKIRPDIRVIIITAYGTVESAVEAMKLGAVSVPLFTLFGEDALRYRLRDSGASEHVIGAGGTLDVDEALAAPTHQVVVVVTDPLFIASRRTGGLEISRF